MPLLEGEIEMDVPDGGGESDVEITKHILYKREPAQPPIINVNIPDYRQFAPSPPPGGGYDPLDVAVRGATDSGSSSLIYIMATLLVGATVSQI